MVQEEQKNGSLSFFEYYQVIKSQQPCLAFRQKIAEACGVTENSVSRWLANDTKPDKLKKEQISKLLGTPVEVLFPEK